MEECLWTSRSAGRRGGMNIEEDQTEEAAERGCIILGGVGKTLPKRETVGSERRADLSLSNSMRVNERRGSSGKLLNELGGRYFIIS